LIILERRRDGMSSRKIGVGVGVMILNSDGEVLLGLRSGDSGSDLGLNDVWTLPGGKVEYGESFEDAGAREVLEETGLVVRDLVVKAVQVDKNEKAHYVTIGLVADSYEGEPTAMEPAKITRWEWFDLDELPINMYFPSARFIEKYRRGVFYDGGER
jgi:ADP-ribose pyrophosphatase YjhB (NUDIX family)